MRRFHWLAPAAAGILLGCLLSAQPITWAARPAPPPDTCTDLQEETLNQLKEANAQLKELGTLLRSGNVKVTVVINPDASPE